MKNDKLTCPIACKAQSIPNKCAIQTKSKIITYEIMNNKIARIANRLYVVVSPNDVVIIKLSVPLMCIYTYWAILRLKAIPVIVDPNISESRYQQVVKKSGAKLIIDNETMDHIHVVNDKERTNKILLAREQCASVLLTSGFSDQVKLAFHTVSNYLAHTESLLKKIPLATSDNWLLSLPLHHITGLSVLWSCALSGATLVISNSKSLQNAIQVFNITHVSLLPTQIKILLRVMKTTAKLKHMLIGDAKCPATILDECVRRHWPIYTTYSMTEATSQVTVTNHFKADKDINNILDSITVKVKDKNRIFIKGDSLFQGYFDNGEVTKPLDKNGFFDTNDLGYFDENGHLELIGRKERMFKAGGKEIHPEEIEQACIELESVECAHVIAIEGKNKDKVPVAFVKIASHYTFDENLIKRQLQEKLESFKVPDRVYRLPNEVEPNIKLNPERLRGYL